MKPQNLSSSLCPEIECRERKIMKPIGVSLSRDGVQETMKPQNHATKKPVNISLFRYGVHGEKNNETTKTMKPQKHETMNPIGILLSSVQILHETMKHPSEQRWSAWKDKP